MIDTYRLIFSTCPDAVCARNLAQSLVDGGLAACVNILPGITSVYAWKGVRETSTECLLLIKTRMELYGAVEQAIRDLHPYELPEIIAVPVEAGLPAYLAWISEATQK